MTKKRDLKDFTFLVIVRLDSIDRLENILLSTSFLDSNLQTNIIVLESAAYNNGILKRLLKRRISYIFLEDNDTVLYRTNIINRMTKFVTTKYLSVWDADVIIPVQQILHSANLLRSGEADFVYPYDYRFLDTSAILKKILIQDGILEILEKNTSKMKEMYLPVPVGGAFFANLITYINTGMENEQFYGWGLEDGERYYRWEKLGCKILRAKGPLFHLSHGRGLNSSFQNIDQLLIKGKFANKVRFSKNPDLNTY